MTPQPAIACQYEFAPEPVGGPSAKFIGRKMGAVASFIDVAMAEGASDVRGPDGKPSISKALNFRVIDRWKGNSPDRFILFGWVPPKPAEQPQWSMTHWVDDQGRVEPYESVRESTVAMPAGGTSCDPSALAVTPGRIYLVYREADGRLLGAVPYHEGSMARRGTPIVEVGLWPDNDWARELHIGAYVHRTAFPAQTRDPSRATVRFRKPMDAKRVSELLRRANAQPFAVTMVRGGVTSEYRLDANQAWPGILADAAAWGSSARTDPAMVRAQAAALVDAYPARDLTNDGMKQLMARKLLALAEAPAEKGPPLIHSVAIVGDANVQRALVSRPEVAEVTPAPRIRDRAASGPVTATPGPGEILDQAAGVPLHRRLSKIAGRDPPPSAIEGSWKLVGTSHEDYTDDVMTLTFSGGRVELRSPCIPEVTGSYGFEGLVLEIDMAKQSVKACPQRSSYWLADYFFGDSQALTVRLRGDALTLVGTGGEYRFARVRQGG